MTDVVQQLINAMALGSQYALLALGLAIVFSIMGLVNFAHGELITIALYAMLGMSYLGVPTWALPIGALFAAIAAAVATERMAFRIVRNAAPTTMLLTSLGVSILIQNAFILFVATRPRAVPTSSWISSSVTIGALRIQTLQVLMTALTLVALGALVLVLKRTLIGISMRAAAENFRVVRLMGVRANRVVMAAFALSGFLAGIAAIFIAARRGAVDPFMGFIPVLKAFVSAVLGGFGSLGGAVVGGFSLGAIEVLFEVVLPADVAGLRDAFVFIVVGCILSLRPQGLLGQRSEIEETP